MEHILNKIVQVFFLLGQPSYWNPAEPNWFYYWKQFVDKKKTRQIYFLSKWIIVKPEYCNDDEVNACISERENAKIMYYTQKSSEYNDETTH